MRPAAPTPRRLRGRRSTAAADEYRHVSVTGRFLHDRETLVQAVTELGTGYWVLTPLAARRRHVVLVNRGFVPSERRDRIDARRPATGGQVDGHRPAAHHRAGRRLPARQRCRQHDRWYSRDVAGDRGRARSSATSRPTSSMPMPDHNPAAARSAA